MAVFLKVGDIVDRYVVEGLVAEGGTAAIYRVRHAQLGSLHALKVLRVVFESLRQRTVIEGRIQARVRHPNLVPVTDIISIHDVPALVMDFVDGPTLEDWLTSGERPLEQLDAIARGILEGVAFAHESGLVHRDLKPSNVILARDGIRLVPRIVDFGLAKAIDIELENATRSGAMMGTLEYMAPEQIVDSKNVDARADLYSVSAMLYEALVGTTPYSGTNLVERHSRAVVDDYLDLASLRPDLEPRFIEAVTAGLRGRVQDRVVNARTLLALWVGNPPVPLPDDAMLWGGSPEPAAPPPERTLVPPSVIADTMPEWAPSAPPRPQSPQPAPTTVAERRPRWPWLAVGAATVALLLVWGAMLGEEPAPAPSPPPPEVVAEVTPAQPEPVTVPADVPPPEAEPEPVPQKRPAKQKERVVEIATATPPPEKAAGIVPNVTIDGVERAYLRDGAGKTWLLPASVPAGRYQLYVFWDPDKATATKNVVVDGSTTIHCVPNLRMCQ
jgi:eukaryotic-like serine/threonine-protein kinase